MQQNSTNRLQNADLEALKLAEEFLLQQIEKVFGCKSDEECHAILVKYLTPETTRSQPTKLNDIYRGILSSAQNANMKPKVIGGAIGGFENLGLVTNKFDPAYVVSVFHKDPNALFEEIKDRLLTGKSVRSETRSIWPKYIRTMQSAAEFLIQFQLPDGNCTNFMVWAKGLYNEKKTTAALPLLLSAEIYGLGYTLACDFLKEHGFINYGKPDVHIADMFKELHLCSQDASPYEMQKSISRIAESTRKSAYEIDKLFWLIGSGEFYLHKEQLGNKGKTKGKKAEFLEFATKKLSQKK